MAVAYMMFIKELWRNGGGTSATAEKRQLPPNFLFVISRRIRHFQIIWDQLFFLEKNYRNICTLHFFGWTVNYLKYFKCQIQK